MTVMTKLKKDEKGFPDLGISEIVGFRHELEDAKETVKENMCDIWETMFNYALIEKVEPCLYPDCLERWFFRYNRETGKYEEIEEPDWIKNFAGIGF